MTLKEDEQFSKCEQCKHAAMPSHYSPCRECKNTVSPNSLEYERRPFLFEPKEQSVTAENMQREDIVNHPAHYETGKFECIEVMEEALGAEKVKAFCLCNAFKYLYRCGRKNGLEDIKKAKWYIDKLIELEER